MATRKEDKELATISDILESFKNVDDDRRQYVLEYVRERLKLGQSITSSVANPQMSGQTNPISIATFVRQKTPSNNYQKIAVLGYYMQKNEGKEEFSLKDLEDANTKAKQPKISNTSRDVRDARNKYRYITQGVSSGMSQLTTFGEDVVEALPDQNVVKMLKPKSKRPTKKSKKVSK